VGVERTKSTESRLDEVVMMCNHLTILDKLPGWPLTWLLAG